MIRRNGKHPNIDQVEKIQDRRRKLLEHIQSFEDQARVYIPRSCQPTRHPSAMTEWEDFDDDPSNPVADQQSQSREDESPDAMEIITLDPALPVEKQKISLPSSFNSTTCAQELKSLANLELELRIGQANDTLGYLRLAIGQKSFIYRTKIRHGSGNSSQRKMTRNYTDVHAIQVSIGQAARVYLSCRAAMETLGASSAMLDRYRILKPTDVVASTTVMDPNARGQRNNALSWIWHLQHYPNDQDPAWMDECKCNLISMTLDFNSNATSISCKLAKSKGQTGSVG